jgi:hypothetical protein
MQEMLILHLCLLFFFVVPDSAPEETSQLISIPGQILRVRPTSDGSVLVLNQGLNQIDRYSSQGVLLETYPTDSPEAPVRETLDFALDKDGNIHALVFLQDLPRFLILVMKKGEPTYIPIRLKRWQGWHLEVDRSGCYYLLGLDSDAQQQIAGALKEGKEPRPKSISVVHKFSPSGSLLRSGLPLPVPTHFQDYHREVLNPLFQRASFAALENGECFFLRTVLDPKEKISEHARFLYKVTAEGVTEELVPNPPRSGLSLMGVHNANGQIVLEWLDAPSFTTVLARLDSSLVAEFRELGLVMAIKDESVFSRKREGLTVQLLKARMN